MGFDINTLLEITVNEKASDLHIHVGESPLIRLDGSIMPIEGPILTSEDTEKMVKEIMPEHLHESLNQDGSADFAYIFRDGCRFRVNAYRARGNLEMVMRLISNKLFSLSEIGLPLSITNVLQAPHGLILVTGPTGAGKTTTLAAMIDWLNSNIEGHIVTIEDPIEYYYTHKRCVFSQRELGSDVNSFHSALRSCLRQDPDIILVGEMRDLDTIEAAVTAAETGHLVLSTLHTTGAARTIDRVIDVFPPNSKEYIRIQLASNLIAVISQALCKKKGAGRVAAFEIMIRTDAIGALIRDNKTFRILSEIQTGGKLGMITLDSSLVNLYKNGLISESEVLLHAQNPLEIRRELLAES